MSQLSGTSSSLRAVPHRTSYLGGDTFSLQFKPTGLGFLSVAADPHADPQRQVWEEL